MTAAGMSARRTVSIGLTLAYWLSRHGVDQAADQLRTGDPVRGTKDGYVFTTSSGEPIYPTARSALGL